MTETCITFGGIGSARVMIEDEEVQHYAMHVDPAKKEVSCWIASEAGKAFSVVWFDSSIGHPTTGTLYLDGHYVRSALRGSEKTPITFRVVTDDDTFLESSSSCSVGEIKLVIHSITILGSALMTDFMYNAPPLPQKVHERSKKAIAHGVKYGSEVPDIPRKQMRSKVAYHEVVATFIFKYRPLDMLQANQIAPRNPEPLQHQQRALDTSPTPKKFSGKRKHSEVKEEFDSEGESEDDEESKGEKALLAEIQRCQAEVERLRKARQSKDDEHPKKRTKKENKTFFIPGEIIDLT